MIRIHIFNTDGYPFNTRIRKSLYSTLAQLLFKKFIQKYPSENIVSSHYVVLKEIYQNGSHYDGVTANYPFIVPLTHTQMSTTSQCLLVEYSSGEFRAIDFTDRNNDILGFTLLEKFTGAMVFQYDQEMLKKRSEIINAKLSNPPFTEPTKLHPGYYSIRGYYSAESDDVLQFSKYVTKENSKLYFRGLRTNVMRACLHLLAMYPDTAIFETSIQSEKYFAEFGSHRVALGLPGGGDLCFRDFEAFALKIPLLRPEYTVTLAEPLIPDYHYVKVDVRDRNNMEMLAEDIITRYREVIHDAEFLDFISGNAYEYYLNFGTYEKVAQKCFEFLQPTI